MSHRGRWVVVHDREGDRDTRGDLDAGRRKVRVVDTDADLRRVAACAVAQALAANAASASATRTRLTA
jgi:hypothetical protein